MKNWTNRSNGRKSRDKSFSGGKYYDVKCCKHHLGIQKGKSEYYRGVPVEPTLLPKVQVDMVVSKVPVRTVIETAKKVLYTGHIGDGKIFVYDVENVVKVRTGEEGYDALQDIE